MEAKRQVQQVHLTARGPDGRVLALVSYSDGTCGITCDGEPSAEHVWPKENLDRCVSMLLVLLGLSA